MNPRPASDPAALRSAAEARLKEQAAPSRPHGEADLRRLQQELEVHQVELELQNEELRAAHAEIATALERYTDHFDFAPVGYFNLSADGTIRVVNLTGARLLGIERARLAGRRFGMFVAEASRQTLGGFLARVFATATIQTCELALERPGRSPLAGLLEATLSPDGQECRAVLIDITERRQVEDALRGSERRYAALVNHLEGIVWEADAQTFQFTFVNEFAEKLLGYPLSRWLEPAFWREHLHPDDRDAAVKYCLEATARGAAHNLEYRMIASDGRIVWLRDLVTVEIAGGKPLTLRGVMVDLTERKLLEEKFLRVQRMEAIGTLTGGIAHDLNNILAPITLGSGLLMNSLTAPHDRELMKLMQTSAERGANVIRQLLTFSRGIAGERVAVQLRHLLTEMIGIMHETFPRNIALEDHAARDLLPVKGDATQLHQVIMNLCVNARDAMPDGGVLTLAARNVELGDAAVRAHPSAKPGPHVAMTVTDTGAGIPPGIIDRIFEPFFSTKALSKGTGLGLSTVSGIVRSHAGFVTVESAPGKGTTFTVHLPVAAGAVCNATAPTDTPPRGRGELILVVDDEEAIRQTTRLLLEQHGYQVVTAGNGMEALDTFQQHRADVRLVLTDMMMPVMGGAKLIWSLRGMEPKLRVIATSGLTDHEKHAELKTDGLDGLLLKPCKPHELLETIARQLAASE